MWKYVDDSTISETVQKNEESQIQENVDRLVKKTNEDKFQMNESKCKEIRISFAKTEKVLDPITINNSPLEVVKEAKILGLNISNNLKWNIHVTEIVKKASKRLYFLTQLKRSKVGSRELVQFFVTCIRSLIEYACPVYHDGLPDYLSNDLERIQKRAMHIIYPSLSYHAALLTTELVPLSQRRQQLTDKLFQQILNDKMHKLHKLLPDVNNTSVNLRKKSKFIMPSIKTEI